VALWPTPEGRARAVQAYRDCRRAEQARHQEWEGDWQAPRSESVRRLVAEAFAPRTQLHDADQGEVLTASADIDDVSAEELAEMRAVAWGEFMAGETSLVTTTVDTLGRPAAERIYGADLVQRARKLAGGSSLMTIGRR